MKKQAMPSLLKLSSFLTLRMTSKALIVTYTAHPDPGSCWHLSSLLPLGLPLYNYIWGRQASIQFLEFLEHFCASAPSTNFSSVLHFH